MQHVELSARRDVLKIFNEVIDATVSGGLFILILVSSWKHHLVEICGSRVHISS